MTVLLRGRHGVVAIALSLGWLGAMTVAAAPPAANVERAIRRGLPDARPVPRMQVIPLPEAQASFQRDGEELTRAHFGRDLRRPFLFPIIGIAGRSLTRLGHPHDPEGHSHHNSVWVAHDSVNGESFWGDRGSGRIVHQ